MGEDAAKRFSHFVELAKDPTLAKQLHDRGLVSAKTESASGSCLKAA